MADMPELELKDKLTMYQFAIEKSLEAFASFVTKNNLEDDPIVDQVGVGLSLVSRSLATDVMKMICGTQEDFITDLLSKVDFDSIKPEDFNEDRSTKDHRDVTDFDGNDGYL